MQNEEKVIIHAVNPITSYAGDKEEQAAFEKSSTGKDYEADVTVGENEAESKSISALSAEEEQQLLEHLPTVRYLARRICERLPQHVELDDLVSAGVVGLLDALRKFDRTKKVQFRSYAQFRIRGAILDSLRMLDWSPRELRRKGRAVEEAIRTLTARYGRSPQEGEVAEEMGLSLHEYQQLLGDLKGLEIGTLHVERSEDSGEDELAYLPNNPEDDPLFRCLKSEMRDRLIAAIESLPERERMVMTLYYYEEMTMKEIGLTLGVVESRISQVHSSAIMHLRALLGGGGRKPPEGRTKPDTKFILAAKRKSGFGAGLSRQFHKVNFD